MITIEDRVEFFRLVHLFADLTDEQLTKIAEFFVEAQYEKGEMIFEQGSPANSFYIIYSGQVCVIRREKGLDRQLAVLVRGDYFGEASLKSNAQRSATVQAERNLVVLTIDRKQFEKLLILYPILKKNVEVSVRDRREAHKRYFKWVRDDEVVYFLARKHFILLLRGLIVPVLLLILPLLILPSALTSEGIVSWILIGILVFGLLLWMLWIVIDWGNDFYLVTNQRVVWLEKVIGIYDSRQEAPLSTILSVGVETDLLGRVLDFGDVIVRTYVGHIPLRFVDHPHQAAHIVEEIWQRTKEISLQAEKEAIKETVREKLGLSTPEMPAETLASEEVVQATIKPGVFQDLISRFFRMRTEDGATITYRKHWFVLLRRTGWPLVFILGTIGLLMSRLVNLFQSDAASLVVNTGEATRFDTLFVSGLILLFLLFLWWLYQFADWRNDIFQVTPEQILDIDRKPFGTEQRRSAPLENILSTEYARIGLLGYLFNYGTVYITVGATQLAFENVLDPASVQQDIDRRRLARIAKKQEDEINAERDRMAEWLVAYHSSKEELREGEDDL